MRDMGRFLALVMLTVGLAACSARDVVLKVPPPGYVAGNTAGVDWSAAPVVSVRLAEYSFDPDALTFEVGKAYRLRLENTGTSAHTFVSKGFFKAIAAAELSGPQGTIANPYVEAIALEPGVVRELAFVAVRAGRYDLECTQPGHALFGMTGTIVIR